MKTLLALLSHFQRTTDMIYSNSTYSWNGPTWVYFPKASRAVTFGAFAFSVLITATIASAQTCPTRLQLRPVPAASRGGTIIWKSNWNKEMQRENTIEEGNHSQKGAALLVHYRSKKYISNGNSLEVRDLQCKLIGRMGRFPRCTVPSACGEHERWYLRAPGGSNISPAALAERAKGSSVLIRLKGRQWAVIQDVLSEREIFP